MQNLITLKFDRTYGGHLAGQLVSVPSYMAEKLVALAVAHVHAPSTPAAETRKREATARMIKKSA